MHKKLILLFCTLATLFGCLTAQAQYSVDAIPNPKSRGSEHYVSDPDHNLSSATISELDAISAGIEKNNDSEFAIVIVNDYDGSNDFEFALDLFTHWGIGKKGSNNGLLLFLSMDRHEYRFITGYGLEGIFPDALLGRIGQDYLVPYMRDGNTDMAVLAAAKAVESVFLSPKNQVELADLSAYQPTFWNRHGAILEKSFLTLAVFVVGLIWISLARIRIFRQYAPKRRQGKQGRYKGHLLCFIMAVLIFALLLFVSLFAFMLFDAVDTVYQFKNLPGFVAVFCSIWLTFCFYSAQEYLRTSTQDIKTGLDMQAALTRLCMVPLLLAPFAYTAYSAQRKQRKDALLRNTPPAMPGSWSRLDQDNVNLYDLKKYLTELQFKEKKLGSKSYEIWLDEAAGSHHVVGFPGFKFNEYDVCPECHGQTLRHEQIKVLERPTRKKEGVGERVQECDFCTYSMSLGKVALDKLGSSSGSGSSSGGSSGGGGGSSGSSFGGGSSGGGGAGGRW